MNRAFLQCWQVNVSFNTLMSCCPRMTIWTGPNMYTSYGERKQEYRHMYRLRYSDKAVTILGQILRCHQLDPSSISLVLEMAEWLRCLVAPSHAFLRSDSLLQMPEICVVASVYNQVDHSACDIRAMHSLQPL